MRILFWIATFTPMPQIQKNALAEGFSISIPGILWYKKHENYQKPIQRIREKWGNDILNIELAHKRRRLEELSKIYEKTYQGREYKIALNALYQIQHEVEKDLNSLNVQNMQVNVYKDMTEAELEEERLKSLERLKLLKGEVRCLAEKNLNTSTSEETAGQEEAPQSSENEKES